MKLKAVLSEDEFGELEETTKGLYAQNDDGKYVLDVDGVDDLPQIQGLKRGHQNSKRERDEAKRQTDALKRKLGPLADLEDLDLSDAEQERLEKLLPYLKGEADLPEPGDDGDDDRRRRNKDGKDNNVDIEKIKTNARRPLERDLESVTAERDSLQAQLQSFITDSALTAALDEIRVASPFKRAVKAMFRDRVKIAEGEKGEPTAIIEGEYGDELPVAKYLKEWAQTDEGKEFVEAPGNQGGGARSNASDGNGITKNPWSDKNWSPKEQTRIYRDLGPDIARRMAAEHNKKVL